MSEEWADFVVCGPVLCKIKHVQLRSFTLDFATRERRRLLSSVWVCVGLSGSVGTDGGGAGAQAERHRKYEANRTRHVEVQGQVAFPRLAVRECWLSMIRGVLSACCVRLWSVCCELCCCGPADMIGAAPRPCTTPCSSSTRYPTRCAGL
eukprot:1470220-Rhodomonas_salina.2